MKNIIGNKFLVFVLAIINGSIHCDTDINSNFNDIESDLDSFTEPQYKSLLSHSSKNEYPKRRHWHRTNFIITDFLDDGEMERRLSLNGVAAKETSLGNDR